MWRMPGARFIAFAVPQIPDAVGYDTTGPNSRGHAVLFAAGRFYYRVDSSAPPGDPGAPSRAQLISAAAGLYQRMRAGGPV